MITLENDEYRAVINSFGAELTHLNRISDNYDYLWNGSQWPKHAPILFPAIGRSNEDAYLWQSQLFPMPQHGFAADEMFEIRDQTTTSVTLVLVANEHTKTMYPFDFELQAEFSLTTTGLVVNLTVINHDKVTMPYALGYHPAFNVPFDTDDEFTDNTVVFTGNQAPLEVFEIVKTPAPFRTGKLEPFAGLEGQNLALTHDKFAQGLRIIANNDVKTVTIKNKHNSHAIKVDVSDFKNVCLWTKEDIALPFLCIEPFNGLPDIYGPLVDWADKEANIKLAPGAHRTSKVVLTMQ